MNIQGKIENSQLIFNQDEFTALAKNLEGKDVDVMIKELKDARNNAQNKLYWKYLSLIQQETGNDQEDLHEFFKRFFLSAKTIKCFNTPIKIPGTTTSLDKKQFSEYLGKIEKMSGVAIPNIWLEQYENSLK